MDNKFVLKEKQRSSKGFTIIELIVTMLIISIAIPAILGIFVRSLQIQRRALSVQQIQENALFVLEAMARELRVSRITSSCPDGVSGCTIVTLDIVRSVDNEPVSYRLDTLGNVIRHARGIDDQPPGQRYDTIMNSADVDFLKLDFRVTGLTADCQQPKVTIVAAIQNRPTDPSIPTAKINLQTSVTLRDLSEELQNPPPTCL